jgi:hypothetical protein
MHPITIQKTLPGAEGLVVLADDAQKRSFVGASRDRGDFVFVQIDRVTMLELERGVVDVRTVVAERCVGMTFEAPADAVALDATHDAAGR